MDNITNYNKYYHSGGLHAEEAECIHQILQKYQIKTITEVGCGNSSTSLFLDYIRFQSLTEAGYSLTSYENNNSWAERVSQVYKHNVQKYAVGDLYIKERCDLIFIDGPVGSSNRESSFIAAKGKSSYVIAHDAFGSSIREFANKHFLSDKTYTELKIKQPNKTSGLILMKSNEG